MPYSPQTRNTLNAANAAIAAGDDTTASALIKSAYRNGTPADRALIEKAITTPADPR